jgi:hypothetical protein
MALKKVSHTKRKTKIEGSEKRVLIRTLVPKMEEVTRHQKRFYNEELHYLFSSSNFVRVIRFRGMRCVGHVA